ncbi:MAG: Uma2 family endonuclease [Chthoniobacteraceae bacterium]
MATLTANARLRLPRTKRHPALLTSEEFLDWLQPGIHADLIGGFIHMHSPVHFDHAKLLNFLDRLLAGYIEEEKLGELHRENIAVRLSPRQTFMPDLAFFTNAQVARLPGTHAPFAPTWVCEVLSPSSVKRDTEQKFAAYELHRVPEYWVLDPRKLVHRFYRLHVDVLEEYAEGADRIESVSIPGFWVKRAWLNPEKLPTVKSCLAEILRSHNGSGR